MGAESWHRLRRMSAAAVISPMLITFLGMDPYLAVGIALSSDVLASAVSAYTYGEEQKFGHSQWAYYDGQCAGLYRGGQLHRQYRPLGHHGEAFPW